MKPDVEDALYSACSVTTKRPPADRMRFADHPRAQGTFHNPPLSVKEFTAKLKTFLGEIDATMTIGDLLDELRDDDDGEQT